MRRARREFSRLPDHQDGCVTTDFLNSEIVIWHRHPGFSTQEYLHRLHGPFIEVAGPTPLFDPELGTPTWGEEVDLTNLPRPLVVTNILPMAEQQTNFQRRTGHTFLQADGTFLPFRDASVGAVFCRGLSLYNERSDYFDMNSREMKLSSVIRVFAMIEAWRVLEPGGIFYFSGARLIDVAVARLLGLELIMYYGAPDLSRTQTVLRENVYVKPVTDRSLDHSLQATFD